MSETLGQRLASSREKRGMTIDEISEITRLSPRLIKAAEDDQFDQLPGRVFVIGFLRSYTKAIGIDGDEFVAMYKQDDFEEPNITPPSINMPIHPDSTKFANRAIVALFVTLLILLAGYYLDITSYFADEKRSEASSAIDETSFISYAKVISDDSEPFTNRPRDFGARITRRSDDATARIDEEIKGELFASTVDGAVAGSKKKNKQTTDLKQVKTPLPLNLKIVAKKNTWIKAEVDGGITKITTLLAGKNMTLRARKGYVLSIGNVSGTRLFLNDKEIKLKQTRSNVLSDYKLPNPASPSASMQ